MSYSRGYEIIETAGQRGPGEAVLDPPAVVFAFADERFAGNPAGIGYVPSFPSTEQMLDAARRAALPTTAFIAPSSSGPGQAFDIRWFTPKAELDLCGHATLAAAHWLFQRDRTATRVLFYSRSGSLVVTRDAGRISMRFPQITSEPVDAATAGVIQRALGLSPVECRRAYDDLIVIVADTTTVAAFQPDLDAIRELDCRGIALTARAGSGTAHPEFDIVSRFFAPTIGVDEDQVCVSAHCKLYPYWAEQLGRDTLRAFQASASGGVIELGAEDGMVVVTGTALSSAEVGRGLTIGAPEQCAIGVALRMVSPIRQMAPFRMATFQIEPRCATIAEAHEVEEIWYIASGSGRVTIDDVMTEVSPGDIVYFPPHAKHQLRNVGSQRIEAVSLWWGPSC